MPALEQMDRKQWAVLWAYVGHDTYGLPIVSDGVEIKVRWVDKVAEMIDATGNTIQSDAQVLTNQYVPIDSIMWKGRLRDVSGPPYPGLHIVKGDNTTPDIKNRHNRYEYALMRYSTELPERTGTGT